MFLRKRLFSGLVLGAVLAFAPFAAVQAAQSSSANWQVDETYFGSGGDLNDCSTNYCAKTNAGEITDGNTSSPNYQAQAGFNSAPYLQFIVNASSIDLGTLTTSATKTASATFSVKTYLSSGYIVQTYGLPTNSGYTLNTMTGTAATPGTEQFGINLVANTSPAVGANPVQVPDATFSYGVAAAGYNTPNVFRYNNGDTVASSPKSSGETDYTVSYVFNVSNVTPGGTYTLQHELVATSTY
jgi:hypothetical protein